MKIKRLKTFFILACVAVFALILFIFVLFPRGPELPAPLLFPTRIAAAIRFKNFGEAYDRHWKERGGNTAARKAIEKFLDAAGAWEGMVEELGEEGAHESLEAKLKALFFMLGTETWIVAADWDVSKENKSPEPTLMAFVQVDSIFKAPLEPLARLLAPKENAEVIRLGSVKILSYRNEDGEEAFAVAKFAGWIVASFGSGAYASLEHAVNNYHAAGLMVHELSADVDVLTSLRMTDFQSNSPLCGTVYPSYMNKWRYAYTHESDVEEGLSKKEWKRRQKDRAFWDTWFERIEGVSAVGFHDEGNSLFDLTFEFTIPDLHDRPAFRDPENPLDAVANADDSATSPGLQPSLLQMDFARGFVTEGSELLGFDWDEILDGARDIEWVRPDLASAWERIIEADGSESKGDCPQDRVGFALIPSPVESVPVAAVWESCVTKDYIDSPADHWRISKSEGDPTFFKSFGVEVNIEPAKQKHAEAKRQFAHSVWNEIENPPLAFVAFNFEELLDSMNAFPAVVLKKKDQERWIEYRTAVEGMNIAVGSLAARVDRKGDSLELRLRVMPNAGTP